MKRVRAMQARQDHPLHLITDDGDRILTRAQQRNFHDQRQGKIRVRHPPEARHPAGRERFLEMKPVDRLADPQMPHIVD
jgi:hypothetical protein